MLLSCLLLVIGIFGASDLPPEEINCDDNCRRTPIFVEFRDTCDESCAQDVLERANATYGSFWNYTLNQMVIETLPDDYSWDMIVESDEVMSVECHVCQYSGIYQPVCGSDGVTYNSAEALECEAQCPENGTEPVTVAKQGVCEVEYVCYCPNRKTPINVWFDQSCDETCATQIMESVNAVDYTIEYGLNHDDLPSIVNQTYKAVLNTDLADEDMDQLLDTLHVVRVACQDYCPRIHSGIDSIDNNPICGTDGQDYANENELECAVGNWCPGETEHVYVAWYGTCYDGPPHTTDDPDASPMLTASTALALLLLAFA
jgi:hypothetical protein